jgi:hypothetical protein
VDESNVLDSSDSTKKRPGRFPWCRAGIAIPPQQVTKVTAAPVLLGRNIYVVADSISVAFSATRQIQRRKIIIFRAQTHQSGDLRRACSMRQKPAKLRKTGPYCAMTPRLG